MTSKSESTLISLNELGKLLSKAREYLENNADVLAEHLFKIYYYKDIRKTDMNGWKKTVTRIAKELIKNNLDKSNNFTNYSEGELLIKLWDEPLSGVNELKVINNFLIKLPDEKGRVYPKVEILKHDPLVFKRFISKMIEGILEGEVILEWDILEKE